MKNYLVATLGMALVALGVAVSLKSNLGTSPISCPPAVMNLRWPALSFGMFTWIVNFSFIFLQLALLRSRFRWADLMQIPAVLLFGLLCDGAVWLCQWLPADSYALQLFWCLLSIVITAVGLRIEIDGRAWMLSGDKTVAVIADVTGTAFSTVKVWSDIVLVLLASAFAWFAFGNFFGNGTVNVIREGTLLLALLTGLCMKLTDPPLLRFLRKLGLTD
ncbi:MAG: hypothetical protein IJ692_07390 [Alloprevotella sp.]|nr:hypothetical protein [Alloprevotella sp.]MBR1652364.1 hypothetical protein [Alloprevotella sp.]MBR1653188.1 hypothetical protein [Alloprevotella sp.]